MTRLSSGPCPFSTTRYLSTTTIRKAPPHPLTFPTHRNPGPLDIFHFTPDTEFTPKLVKERYYELCRLYHPDLRKGKESASSGNSGSGPSNPPDTTAELKQINAAYEILRNPSKRNTYLRTGYGWGTGTGAGVGGMSPNHRYRPAGSAAAASYAYGYDFVRGRPMRYTRGAYPSSAWDWSDPHNTRFRPGFAGGAGDGAAGMGGGSAAGWGSQGHVGSNGVVFLALCSLTLFVTPLTLWSATPTTGSEQGRSGLVPMVSDRRHVEAAKALETARREARSGDGGREKREAISRRVRMIERARAFERAKELKRIEQQQQGTGHLALPAPKDSPPPPP